jgi:hypothetical protein
VPRPSSRTQGVSVRIRYGVGKRGLARGSDERPTGYPAILADTPVEDISVSQLYQRRWEAYWLTTGPLPGKDFGQPPDDQTWPKADMQGALRSGPLGADSPSSCLWPAPSKAGSCAEQLLLIDTRLVAEGVRVVFQRLVLGRDRTLAFTQAAVTRSASERSHGPSLLVRCVCAKLQRGPCPALDNGTTLSGPRLRCRR